eukprot:733296-Hanusia_phi.AAC.3
MEIRVARLTRIARVYGVLKSLTFDRSVAEPPPAYHPLRPEICGGPAGRLNEKQGCLSDDTFH